MRSVENAECRKCGVWKMRSEKKNQFSISISHFSVENEACVIWKVTNDRYFFYILVERGFYNIVTHASK